VAVILELDDDMAEFLVKDCTSNIELATIVLSSVSGVEQQKELAKNVAKYTKLRDMVLGAMTR
jgi:hypothetical protein